MNARRLTRAQRWGALTLLALIPLAITGLVTGVVGGAAERTDAIPALVVNNDEMVTTTAADGTESKVLAGRLIVTALTGSDSPGFDWSLANEESAAKALKSGTAYAVVTIPSNFSASIASLSSGSPQQASVTMTTDDAHSYLAGSLAQALGSAMTSTLGQGITEQYLSGLFSQLGTFGSSMSTAASGAQQLAGGVAQLHDGLVTFSGGLSAATTGADEFVAGVSKYSTGVDGIASGIDQLNSNAAGLTALSDGVTQYTQGVSQYVAGVCAALGSSNQLCLGGNQLASQGATLATNTASGISGLQGGIAQLNSGAAQLSAGSPALRSGGNSLVDGFEQLSAGAAKSASGAGDLATGAQQMADGLSQGAEQLSGSAADPDATAAVVSEPVTITKQVENPLGSVRDLIALLILPAALWLGALAIFVARRPFAEVELQSTRGSARIVLASTGRAGLFGLVQVALALIAAAIVGVGASALAWGAVLAALASFAFIALHLLLKLVWPRASNLISMVLLVAQIIVLPGILPSEMLPTWIQPIASAFPLTWAMNGMQAIVAGSGYSAAVSAGIGLALIGVLATALTTMILSRRRLTAGFGFAIASAA